jgi:hypothetical protein
MANPLRQSLDDFVDAREQRGRWANPQRFGELEIDHQPEDRRLLDGQIGRLGALQVSWLPPGRSMPSRDLRSRV